MRRMNTSVTNPDGVFGGAARGRRNRLVRTHAAAQGAAEAWFEGHQRFQEPQRRRARVAGRPQAAILLLDAFDVALELGVAAIRILPFGHQLRLELLLELHHRSSLTRSDRKQLLIHKRAN